MPENLLKKVETLLEEHNGNNLDMYNFELATFLRDCVRIFKEDTKDTLIKKFSVCRNA